MIGFLFKLGVAPFHIWVPEIYDGAPNLVTLVLLTLPKITFIIFLIKIIYIYFINFNTFIGQIIFYCIIFSFLFGTLGAIYQIKLKRFIAYSAIANMDLF